jgi:uncharacterized protein (DUF885 family)
MLDVIEESDFDGSFDEYVEFLRNDPQFYPDTAEELLKEASYIAKDIDGKLPQLFHLESLPRRSYGVVPVPEDFAPNYSSGRYSPRSADNEAGFFWVNTYALDTRLLYNLTALFLHEAVPGHHRQIALTQELEDVSEFRKRGGTTAFAEGWCLYSEWLGTEIDVYDTHHEQFGRLTFEMWRACRLVIDTGIHAKGWSRQEAREFLAASTALSHHDVRTKIDRYIASPGQPLAYKMGEIVIRKLREEAEDVLGDEFDQRDFHRVVLENGAVLLPVLEENVRDWTRDSLESDHGVDGEEEEDLAGSHSS